MMSVNSPLSVVSPPTQPQPTPAPPPGATTGAVGIMPNIPPSFSLDTSAAPYHFPQDPEDYTKLSSHQITSIMGLFLNSVCLRYVGQRDYDASDKSHDRAHHYNHLVILDEGLRWIICALGLLWALLRMHVPLSSVMKDFKEECRKTNGVPLLPALVALLYGIEQRGMRVAYYHLPERLFEGGYQLRLFLMALASSYFLQRMYTQRQWVALAGVSLMSAVILWEEGLFYSRDLTRTRPLLGLVVLLAIVACNVWASVLWEWTLQKNKSKESSTLPPPPSANAPGWWMSDSQVHFWLCALVHFTSSFLCTILYTMFFRDRLENDTDGVTYGFFCGFNAWTWWYILLYATLGLWVVKMIESTSCVMEFLVTRVSLIAAGVMDMKSAHPITQNSYLLVIFLATVAEFSFVYAYGVPRHSWPVCQGDGGSEDGLDWFRGRRRTHQHMPIPAVPNSHVDVPQDYPALA